MDRKLAFHFRFSCRCSSTKITHEFRAPVERSHGTVVSNRSQRVARVEAVAFDHTVRIYHTRDGHSR